MNAWAYGNQGYSLPGSQYVPLDEKKRQEQQSNQMPSMSPMQYMEMMGGGAPAGGGMPGFSAAGAEGASSAGGLPAWNAAGFEGLGGSAGGSSGGGGMMSGLLANPYTWIAAAIAGNELYQNNTGNREGESFPLEYAITGRAAYKDKDVWGDKADSIIPGLGSGIRIAGGMSSPADLLRGDTWSDIGDELKSGGVLGNFLKGIF